MNSRVTKLQEIEKENLAMLKRLQKVTSNYDKKDMSMTHRSRAAQSTTSLETANLLPLIKRKIMPLKVNVN